SRATPRSNFPESRKARNRPRRSSCCRGAGRRAPPWRQSKLCSCGERLNHDFWGSARVSRVGDGIPPARTFLKRLFRRDAETNARDARATQKAACCVLNRRHIGASLFYDESDSRASTRGLRLLAEFRRAFEERRPRSETPADRLVRLCARRVERGAVHDRAERRLRFLGKKWRDGFRHVAEGAAG